MIEVKMQASLTTFKRTVQGVTYDSQAGRHVSVVVLQKTWRVFSRDDIAKMFAEARRLAVPHFNVHRKQVIQLRPLAKTINVGAQQIALRDFTRSAAVMGLDSVAVPVRDWDTRETDLWYYHNFIQEYGIPTYSKLQEALYRGLPLYAYDLNCPLRIDDDGKVWLFDSTLQVYQPQRFQSWYGTHQIFSTFSGANRKHNLIEPI